MIEIDEASGDIRSVANIPSFVKIWTLGERPTQGIFDGEVERLAIRGFPEWYKDNLNEVLDESLQAA